MVQTFRAAFIVLRVFPDFDEVKMFARMNKVMANAKERERKRLRHLVRRIREPVGTTSGGVFHMNKRFFVFIDRIGCLEIDLLDYIVILLL